MAWYALPPRRLARQIAADLVMVGWVVGWVVVARMAERAVDQMGTADRVGLRALQKLAAELTQSRDRVNSIPVAGQSLGQVIQQLITWVQQLIVQAQSRVNEMAGAADTVALLVALVPILPVALIWLVTRLGLLRSLSADAVSGRLDSRQQSAGHTDAR